MKRQTLMHIDTAWDWQPEAIVEAILQWKQKKECIKPAAAVHVLKSMNGLIGMSKFTQLIAERQ